MHTRIAIAKIARIQPASSTVGVPAKTSWKRASHLVFALMDGVVLVRSFARALATTTDDGFAQFSYPITCVLVAPFVSVFRRPQLAYCTARVTQTQMWMG
jgi:hypothetical protein